MAKDYGSWSIADLKSELKKRKAKVTGKKAVLVQRLEDYDKLFGPLAYDSSDSVFKISVPSPECFRDVTSDSQMPVLSDMDLQFFCELIEREDVTTSQNMYQENFLLSCRAAMINGEYFITGLCASEMRKNINYNVTIKAKEHFILEAQCECAAGVGPYGQCKHILVLICAVIDFNRTKSIKLRTSCTSTLQTFHQPHASYAGNPVRTENLILKFKDQNMKEMTKFDPRPSLYVETKEKFNENFNNLLLNYQQKKGNMPITQIIMPADKRSLFRDHDYLKKTAEEEYFDLLHLNEDEQKELNEKTKTDKKLWLKERKLRLQSSDFGNICKQNTNKLKLAKNLMKTENLLTPAIKHGRKYESNAIKKFEEVSGLKTTKCGIMIHPQHQFVGCTPDAVVGDKILEVKCPFTAKNKNISPESVPYLYLCDKSGNYKLNESHNYYYQVQGQLFCTQRDMAYFFIYTISDYYLMKITRDEPFIKKMIESLKSFYDDYYKQVLLNKFLYSKKI